MIHQIISFSTKNKLVIGLFALALVVTGIWSMTRVPLDAVPDITNNQVQIITQAPSLGTEDIEQFVTYPVEVGMANLPGVTEIRSTSRFGLSVVTVVFEDGMGTYLPRQLVAEKLTEVKNDIPPGFGEPFMGPISTGLGEIYQYTLEVEEEYRDNYSSSDLREIQDWIVRRQMAMVPGVVEVNAFGGNIKQFEVAINPEELNAMGISVLDVFQALEENNANTGGAYIEKDHYANFIRGEGLARTLEDLEKIVIATEAEFPITIGDVADVRYGHAVKYGAFTKDGKGEAVGGMILMLKGANSNDVITAVKERVEKIQTSLPDGVRIEPFLDRSDLIARTTGTVSENLTIGALIVIFVLVFLLGNWRGGLIVASTIPLSLLFAFILMHAFGVWANLMSLGAIDFGIIIDGAVIIVEGVVFLLYQKVLRKEEITPEVKDEVARSASSKMMNSAFFGQLIILIVFVPILVLQGVEGKMFKPMALTFMFAMIGVMILCLTYVPMMSALFANVSPKQKESWGDKLVKRVENGYEKALTVALKRAKWIVPSALIFFIGAALLFSRMGGEFVPKLDEGDIAFHAILKPGSALSETVETTTKIEKIVKSNFPEVKHIYSRIGVADVPTDPMPMDIADVFVILNPESKWRPGMTKKKLVKEMKEAVSIVPGINFEFTQPIEMRFNELITGVREDVAVKLFGEDLDVLSQKAEEIGALISNIPGVADMKVEATSGLPQITVKYNRRKMAQYGINVHELNQTIQAAFSGGEAGVIFEGEKRFDLVVRFAKSSRKSLEDVKNVYVSLPHGGTIRINELADISYEPGPMQISRENTNRRTYVGVIIRDRDVQSVVNDIQERLDEKLKLPPGYYVRYGGAFENLQRATERLKLVVPVALGLIFLLLFLALKSFKQAGMIYIAIPLAAIGGIFALWLRGMPFSISAGVGFIVLFGVAVLNGLVLISGWNELKESHTDVNERIRLGAVRRIRPIMLTALTDVLGFLPMAISSSAGAEVQRPLATVVIGGMITATLLTLFVLPILYKWMETKSQKRKPMNTSLATILVLGLFLLPSTMINAQTITSVDQVIDQSLKENGSLAASRLRVELQSLGKKRAFNPDRTMFDVQYGQYNSFQNDLGFNVSQNFEFPSVYVAQKRLANERVKEEALNVAVDEQRLKHQVRNSWNRLSYLTERERLLLGQDSLYGKFLEAANIRLETEAGALLEQITAETKVMEIRNQLQLTRADRKIEEARLRLWMNDTIGVEFKPNWNGDREEVLFNENTNGHPLVQRYEQQQKVAEVQKKLEKQRLIPGITIGYFNQSMIGNPTASGNLATGSDRFDGVKAGVSIPLFFGERKAAIKSAEVRSSIAESEKDYQKAMLDTQLQQKMEELSKYRNSLGYYEQKAIPQTDLMINNARLSFESGAIGYVEYVQALDQAITIKLNYIGTVNKYNHAVADLKYIIGQ